MPCTATLISPQQHSHGTATSGAGGREAVVVACAPEHLDIPCEVVRYHEHAVGAGQCCSVVTQTVAVPVDAVWSVVRRFDRPQDYKHFIRSCRLVDGDGGAVGSVREVSVVSGLPAKNSRERLEILDDERRVISFRIVGGKHRLSNYRSVTTVHEAAAAAAGPGPVTNVIESYVVDVPAGNTIEETRTFVDTIVRCNLQSLARMVEQLVKEAPRHN
jgi:abscisic acid receptor PYR/PYL family